MASLRVWCWRLLGARDYQVRKLVIALEIIYSLNRLRFLENILRSETCSAMIQIGFRLELFGFKHSGNIHLEQILCLENIKTEEPPE